jgi:hypothetical protein
MQGPNGKSRRKRLYSKFGHFRDRRVSCHCSLYLTSGKGATGDKPKPKPQPVDPGKKPYRDDIYTSKTNRPQAKVGKCLVDIGSFEPGVDADLRRWKWMSLSAYCSVMEVGIYFQRYYEVHRYLGPACVVFCCWKLARRLFFAFRSGAHRLAHATFRPQRNELRPRSSKRLNCLVLKVRDEGTEGR